MSKENAKKFLEELDTNEKAMAKLKEIGTPTGEADEIRVMAAIARETGYDVSDEELEQMLKSVKKTLASANDKAADGIEKLNLEDLDTMAGGKDYSACNDTYKDGENCTLNDACKKVNNMYYSGNATTCDSYTFCSSWFYSNDCFGLEVVAF